MGFERPAAHTQQQLTQVRLFSRGVIFTHARVSLAPLSLRKNGGLLVDYLCTCILIQQLDFRHVCS